jgi:protein SCO1/2
MTIGRMRTSCCSWSVVQGAVGAVLIAVPLLLAGCATGKVEAPKGGVSFPEPIPKADFTLADTDGKPFHFREATEGYVTLLFFGYTHCPDVCPVHLANIAAALHKQPLEVSRRFRVVFVSTDPDRDNPERLRSWLDNFDHSFIGLRGPIDSINLIQRSFRLAPARREEPTEPGKEYTVGHMALILAFTTDNLAHVAYPFGVRQAQWAEDMPRLVHDPSSWQ